MASNKIKTLGATVLAVVLAAAIPTVGWLYGRSNDEKDKAAIKADQDELKTLWGAKDNADEEALAQSKTEDALAERQQTVRTAIAQSIPGVVCWGDSITAGLGGGGSTYPALLQKQLQSELASAFLRLYPADFETDKQYNLTIPVVNMGVSGENSLTVVGRNGAIPYILTRELTIPADTQSQVRVYFTSQNGETVEPLVGGSTGLGTVTLGGVEGRLEARLTYGEESRYAYYFTRNEAGEALTVAAGTPLETAAGQAYKDYLAVIQLGHNGGYEDADDLIAQIDAIIAGQTNPERYIVLGLAFGDPEQLQTVNEALAAAYGDHFIDLWQYMREEGLTEAKLEPTLEDIEAMEEGFLPITLTGGGNTFNATGYQVLASAVQHKLHSLGYLDAVEEALN